MVPGALGFMSILFFFVVVFRRPTLQADILNERR
jgi:hypothetical protein